MKPLRHPRRAPALATLLCLSAFGASAHPWSYDDVAVFHAPQGDQLTAGVTRGADGLLYGTAALGGAHGAGSVYRIEADGSITVLHSFADDWSEGSNPTAGLLLAADGWFYGGTAWGTGPAGRNGTIFKISPAGEFVQLYAFSGADRGPSYTLAQDAAGNLYGNVVDDVYDAIFKMTPDHQVTILHRFTGQADGGNPAGPLLVGADGTLYGNGDASPNEGTGWFVRCGEVFALSPAGDVHVLHNFLNPPAHQDGCYPMGALAVGNDHRLYGTTFGWGRDDHPWGGVFSLSLDGDFTITHDFTTDDPLGYRPQGGLVADANGALYGTTSAGGAHGEGTVFSLSPKGQVRKVLHAFERFGAMDGGGPAAAPTVLPDGSLAGTAEKGAKSGTGAVYTLTPR